MWAYFLRGHHSTHYRFCWFWREWGQGQHRQQVCLELEGKTESHLSAESKDLVILSSQMQHPTHILRRGDGGRGGSCITVFLLHSHGLSGISCCSGRTASGALYVERPPELAWGWGDSTAKAHGQEAKENKLTMAPAAVGAPGSP